MTKTQEFELLVRPYRNADRQDWEDFVNRFYLLARRTEDLELLRATEAEMELIIHIYDNSRFAGS